jgi:hypothetical protein
VWILRLRQRSARKGFAAAKRYWKEYQEGE